MRNLFKSYTFLVVLVLLVGCSIPQEITFTGKVIEKGGGGIKGVKVRAEAGYASVETSDDGGFKLVGDITDNATITLEFKHDDYKTATKGPYKVGNIEKTVVEKEEGFLTEKETETTETQLIDTISIGTVEMEPLSPPATS